MFLLDGSFSILATYTNNKFHSPLKDDAFNAVEIMRERESRGHCWPYRPLWLKVTADARRWWIIFRICPAPGGESSVPSFWLRRTILSYLCSSTSRSHYVPAGTILPLRFLPLCSHPFFIDIFSYSFSSSGRITYSLDRNARPIFVLKNEL